MAKIKIDSVRKHFNEQSGLLSTLLGEEHTPVQAVSDVSMEIEKGEIVGIAGESGSGKTTLAKMLVKVLEPTEGEIYYDDVAYSDITGKNVKKFRREVQMILQDPYDSLNPRYTVLETVMEPLKIHGIGDNFDERRERVIETLESVGLSPAEAYLNDFPSDLSGGEQQRVCMAQALVLDPEVLIADEPVSMLDVSIRAGVLNQLKKLHKERDMTIIVIGHDLAMMRYLCDKVGIMYIGELAEYGATEEVITDPQHPYTRELLNAVPDPSPERRRTRVHLEGEPPSAEDPPSGCRFHTRCPYAREACRSETPDQFEADHGGEAACYRVLDDHEYWQSSPLDHANMAMEEDDEDS